MCFCGYWAGMTAAGFQPQSGYWTGQMPPGFGPPAGYRLGQKPVEQEPKPEPKPEPKVRILPEVPGAVGSGVSGPVAGSAVPGLGFGVCQLAAGVAILLVICSCFGGCFAI